MTCTLRWYNRGLFWTMAAAGTVRAIAPHQHRRVSGDGECDDGYRRAVMHARRSPQRRDAQA